MMTAIVFIGIVLCILVAANMIFNRRRSTLLERAVQGVDRTLHLMDKTLNTVVELKREHIGATGKLFVRNHDILDGLQLVVVQAADNAQAVMDALEIDKTIRKPKIKVTEVEKKTEADKEAEKLVKKLNGQEPQASPDVPAADVTEPKKE